MRDDRRTAHPGLWAFALLWNAIALPAAALALRDGQSRLALITSVFPMAGLGILVAAVRSSIRIRKFGVSRLHLSTRPAVPGHGLAGTLHVGARIRPTGGFRLVLSCVRIETGGPGGSRRTGERILWQEEQQVGGLWGTGMPGEGAVTVVPVGFRIDAGAPPTDYGDPEARIVWRLSASARMPGVDYAASFEVPVFRPAEAPAPAAQEAPSLPPEPELLSYRPPAGSPIRVTSDGRGTRIAFPRALNPRAALALTALALLWGGALALLWRLGAPAIFPAAFGAVEVVLAWGALLLWLRVVDVRADRSGVRVESNLGWAGGPRAVAAPDIADVEVRIGMQAGSEVSYDLAIVRRDGRRIRAGGGVRDKRQAEWLAAKIKEALGRHPE